MSLKNIAPLIASAFIAAAGYAQTAAPVQSSARPFGLPIAGSVMVGGSDAASATFQSVELPALTQYLSNVLGEGQDINDGDYLLDPSKLFLKTDATFSTDLSVNPDGINHVVSFAAIHGSYLVIGFEDLLGGGDEDFNDVLFAIDIGSVNVAALTGTPEPATYMTMGLFLTGGLWVMRRRKAAKA